MEIPRLKYVVPMYLIVLGLAWLLDVGNVAPDINWVMTIGVAALGVLGIFTFSLNKVIIVICPLLVVESLCSLLKQIGILQTSVELPILFIALGSLLLLVQVLKLPTWKI